MKTVYYQRKAVARTLKEADTQVMMDREGDSGHSFHATPLSNSESMCSFVTYIKHDREKVFECL